MIQAQTRIVIHACLLPTLRTALLLRTHGPDSPLRCSDSQAGVPWSVLGPMLRSLNTNRLHTCREDVLIVAKHPTKTTEHATTWRGGVKALHTRILFRRTIEEYNKALLLWDSACRKRASPIRLVIAIIPEVVDRLSHGPVVCFEPYCSARPQKICTDDKSS